MAPAVVDRIKEQRENELRAELQRGAALQLRHQRDQLSKVDPFIFFGAILLFVSILLKLEYM